MRTLEKTNLIASAVKVKTPGFQMERQQQTSSTTVWKLGQQGCPQLPLPQPDHAEQHVQDGEDLVYVEPFQCHSRKGLFHIEGQVSP